MNSKVDELHESILDLCLKVDQLSSHQEDFDLAKHASDTEYINLMKPADSHQALTSFKVALGPFGHGATHALTKVLATGWSPPSCQTRSKVPHHSLMCHLAAMILSGSFV